MFNVLIVDDESITRNGLVNHIQWDKFDIESISTSASGVDGINFIKNNKVDLVISDVRMPGMTGIEMCSEIKKIAPECQIIFLSGYSDKEYLMGAIELEAVSYVEKPINISEVEMAIEKAINKISTSENRKKEIDSVIEESRKIMSQAFLQKLIKGKLSVEEVKEQSKKLDQDILSSSRFSIAIFKCKVEEEQLDDIAVSLKEKIKGAITIYCLTEYQQIVFLICHKQNNEESVRQIYKTLKEVVSQMDIKIFGTFGTTVPSIMKTKNSYESAKEQIKQLFFMGYGHMSAGTGDEKEKKKFDIDENMYRKFSNALSKFEKNEGEIILNDIKEEVDRNRNVDLGHIKAVYFRLIESILKAAETAKNSKNESSEAEIISFIMAKLDTMDTLGEYHEYTMELMNEYLHDSKDFANNSRVIIEIVEYINKNYSNPYLSLGEIADSVFMTPNYMNGLFKKKFGTTVGQYITNVRIESAKKLIMDRSIKLSEVAVMVGYNDPGYFTKAFRKNVGMSPKDFREK